MSTAEEQMKIARHIQLNLERAKVTVDKNDVLVQFVDGVPVLHVTRSTPGIQAEMDAVEAEAAHAIAAEKQKTEIAENMNLAHAQTAENAVKEAEIAKDKETEARANAVNLVDASTAQSVSDAGDAAKKAAKNAVRITQETLDRSKAHRDLLLDLQTNFRPKPSGKKSQAAQNTWDDEKVDLEKAIRLAEGVVTTDEQSLAAAETAAGTAKAEAARARGVTANAIDAMQTKIDDRDTALTQAALDEREALRLADAAVQKAEDDANAAAAALKLATDLALKTATDDATADAATATGVAQADAAKAITDAAALKVITDAALKKAKDDAKAAADAEAVKLAAVTSEVTRLQAELATANAETRTAQLERDTRPSPADTAAADTVLQEKIQREIILTLELEGSKAALKDSIADLIKMTADYDALVATP